MKPFTGLSGHNPKQLSRFAWIPSSLPPRHLRYLAEDPGIYLWNPDHQNSKMADSRPDTFSRFSSGLQEQSEISQNLSGWWGRLSFGHIFLFCNFFEPCSWKTILQCKNSLHLTQITIHYPISILYALTLTNSQHRYMKIGILSGLIVGQPNFEPLCPDN